MTQVIDERKKPVWPWILLGLGIVALLIYFFAFRNDNKKEATDLINVRENNSTVAAYVNFIDADTNKMSLDHKFTNEALLKLTDATDAMANEIGYDVKADLDKVKQLANEITNDPFETTHADKIRKAAEMLSNVMQNMQKAKYPGLANDVSELKNASASSNPVVLTLDQKD